MSTKLIASTLIAILIGALASCTATSRESVEPSSGSSGKAYLGLRLWERPDLGGSLVSSVLPGPLEGEFWKGKGIRRGDVVLAINGQPAYGETLRTTESPDKPARGMLAAIVGNLRPGDPVVLRVRRTNPPEISSMPEPGEGKEEVELTVTLEPFDKWNGPEHDKLPAEQRPDLAQIIKLDGDETPLESFLGPHIESHALNQPFDDLVEFYRDWVDRSYSINLLSRIAFCFQYPTRLIELEKTIIDPMPAMASKPTELLSVAAANLDLLQPVLSQPIALSNPVAALEQTASRIEVATDLVSQAFNEMSMAKRAALLADADYLIEHTGTARWIVYHDEPLRSIRAVNASRHVDFQKLLAAAGALAGAMHRGEAPKDNVPTARIPSALRRAVTGPILAAQRISDRWLVYGGFGDNTYDMSVVHAVIDPDGDDTYNYPTRPNRAATVIIDMAGDDQHLGQGGGPAAGWLGVSLLVDYAGNDRYEAVRGACGAGVYGAGILLDYSGSDTYLAKHWSAGAGVYGFGAVLDLGGHDTYICEATSQGIGGPRGFGLIYDRGGNDLYRANGMAPSNYNTPAVFSGYSQGMGLGFRFYDRGGIGVICDQGGSDRYEAGEFSQGGGYAWGLGIIHDQNGRDLYYGNRYGQGFGCHQAFGILRDVQGDDTYWSMTAADQGGAWDIAVGLLLDEQGNDHYRADSLSQGGASMQAFAWLIDLAGIDRYLARGSTHGQTGRNTYHYNKDDEVFSWSMLIDAGGAEDFYSSGRNNNEVLSTGQRNEDKPANSNIHGLFIDTSETLKP